MQLPGYYDIAIAPAKWFNPKQENDEGLMV